MSPHVMIASPPFFSARCPFRPETYHIRQSGGAVPKVQKLLAGGGGGVICSESEHVQGT